MTTSYSIDLPGSTERATIWVLSLRFDELDASQKCPSDTDWTDAEILRKGYVECVAK